MVMQAWRGIYWLMTEGSVLLVLQADSSPLVEEVQGEVRTDPRGVRVQAMLLQAAQAWVGAVGRPTQALAVVLRTARARGVTARA